MLSKIKMALKIDDNNQDEDIQDTINAARLDLMLCGISETKANDDTDALVIRAIKTYCKAEFSSDTKESTRYRKSYEMIRNHLSMSVDYNTDVI